MDSPTASIIIPTRNRPQAVEHCLDSLAAQTVPPSSFEVIVVDDGSEPALALDLERWTSKFAWKLIHQKNTGPAGARNRGAAEARGEFLAFTDDDCLPTPTWLETLIAALREYFTKNFTNLQTAGRNGLHRYNNQDHSMLAGHHAALTLLGRKDLDPWEVNTERSYYEEQVLSPDSKHEGTDILVADKTLPHESV
jgi:glycosyltransferase involved in cell wall biosynthesis